MPSRFERYRMRDGATALAERYFNPIWQDLDLRLAAIEELQVSWAAVVRLVTDQGLVRINEVLAPAFEEMNQNLASAGAKLGEIEATRQAALSAIDGLTEAIASYQGNASTDIAQWKATTLAMLTTWKATAMADLEAWKSALQANYLQNVAKASQLVVFYDSQARPERIEETVAGQPRVTTVAYNVDGTVATMVIVYAGITRTETYAYSGGRFSGMTATEV